MIKQIKALRLNKVTDVDDSYHSEQNGAEENKEADEDTSPGSLPEGRAQVSQNGHESQNSIIARNWRNTRLYSKILQGATHNVSESPLAQLIFAHFPPSSPKRASARVSRRHQSIGSCHLPHSHALPQPLPVNITPLEERSELIDNNNEANDEDDGVEVEGSETESSESAEDACFA
ncbi:hypothetical protein ACTXT7_015868 [Hymenolepis weldensis]